MDEATLILYSREGCCLCEALEERLKTLPLEAFMPPLELHVIDIDDAHIPRSTQLRYDLLVPVMALAFGEPIQMIELPRVSPRLNAKGLSLWLQKVISEVL